MPKKFFIILFVCFANLTAQSYSSKIENIVTLVNVDSLLSYVRILSGEDSVIINGKKELIINRVHDTNSLAAEYLFNKLSSYGLSVTASNYSSTGTNIIAEQPGSVSAEKINILCAHYDSVTDFCADDNASGTAAVIEAARILSHHTFDYTLVYALWDEEEIGKLGSKAYADTARLSNRQIDNVINLDMIAFDDNKNKVLEVHSGDYANSQLLAQYVSGIDSLYNLDVVPSIQYPGTTRSDHYAFWRAGYSALLFIEELFMGDFNSYYHSPNDRIDKFDMDYFVNNTKLAVAALADLGDNTLLITNVNTLKTIPDAFSISNYPNPFNNSTRIHYNLPKAGFVSLKLFDIIGREIKILVREEKEAGYYSYILNDADLASGVYLLNLASDNSFINHKIILAK